MQSKSLFFFFTKPHLIYLQFKNKHVLTSLVTPTIRMWHFISITNMHTHTHTHTHAFIHGAVSSFSLDYDLYLPSSLMDRCCDYSLIILHIWIISVANRAHRAASIIPGRGTTKHFHTGCPLLRTITRYYALMPGVRSALGSKNANTRGVTRALPGEMCSPPLR